MRGFSFFLGTDSAGHTNRAGGSLLTGEEFFACDQAGSCALRSAGIRRAPRRGKRVDTYGFYPLNSRFPLFLSLAQTRDRRPLRSGGRQRIFSTVGEHSVLPCRNLYAVSDTVLLHRRFTLRRARHSSAAQLVSLEFTDGTCELGVWYNLSSQKLSVTTR